jgi:excisionase family DNA binding protein
MPRRTTSSSSRHAVDPRRRLVSLAEAAEWAGVCERTLRRRIADGTLTAYRLGPRLIRIDLTELGALLREIPTARSPRNAVW